ncbi:MAG: plasmid maintenance system killer family protein [Bacteroidetes bacterium]|nr:plasmid maintenance system killer family protein [Bacteroidota bacterium]
MIQSFGNTETENIWRGIQSRRFPFSIQGVARRKLRMINSAQNLLDLRVPPANHLEKLKGTWLGYHSIRVNDQWRIVFQWKRDHAFDVTIIDYH